MSWKISVRFLTENTDHEISADPNLTVLQFKELLRQQIPFLKWVSSVPTDVLKLSLEGFDGGETGNVMEDIRSLNTYPLTEERHPVLLALERPVEKIGCPSCDKPYGQWSNNRLCCGDVNEEDREQLEKRKARIPQLLNCGHSVCLECLREGLVAAEDGTTGEIFCKFVCPEKSCGIISYRLKDEEWHSHEGLQRLVHLKKREWVEAEKARGRCSMKNCGAEACFRCPDCGDVKHCISHFNRMHQFEDTLDHVPQVLLSSQVHPSISDIFKTRFCCYCGGETASCVRGGGRPHCEHRDAGLVSARELTRAKVMEQLTTLGNLQADCWRQLVTWNGVMDQLKEHRVKGVERIRMEFDDFIARLEARKEDMMKELQRCYREKEVDILQKMAALGSFAGEVEAGLVHNRQSLEEVCVVRDVVDVSDVQGMIAQLATEASSQSLDQLAESLMTFKSFSESQDFIADLCKIAGSVFPIASLESEDQASAHILENEAELDDSESTKDSGLDDSESSTEAIPAQATALQRHTCEESLLQAARKGSLGDMESLVRAGVDVNCKDTIGWTPLHHAASRGHLEEVKYLLEQGADILRKSDNGRTPLHMSAIGGRVGVLIFLHSQGADIDSKTTNNWTPLHLSAMWGHLEVVKYLLQQGADMHCKDNDGWTPLHFSTSRSQTKVGKYLLQQGADKTAMPNDGITPFDMIPSLMFDTVGMELKSLLQ